MDFCDFSDTYLPNKNNCIEVLFLNLKCRLPVSNVLSKDIRKILSTNIFVKK